MHMELVHDSIVRLEAEANLSGKMDNFSSCQKCNTLTLARARPWTTKPETQNTCTNHDVTVHPTV